MSLAIQLAETKNMDSPRLAGGRLTSMLPLDTRVRSENCGSAGRDAMLELN